MAQGLTDSSRAVVNESRLAFTDLTTADASTSAHGLLPKLAAALVPNFNGIKFPASQVASADANTLDDYEEGTWQMVPNTNLTLNTSWHIASYIKIGKLVFLCGYIEVATVSGTNAVSISIPFASGAAPANGISPGMGNCMSSGVDIGDAGLSIYISSGTTELLFYKVNDNAAFDQLLNSALTAGDAIYFGVTYIAAA
jgi:hypothetical protein